MVISFIVGLTRTGEILRTIPTTETGNSWSMALNQAGAVKAVVPLREQPTKTLPNLLADLEPARCFMAAVTGTGRVLEAGLILPHDYDDTTGRLTVGANGLWAYWEHRKVLPPSLAKTDLTFSDMSLGTIAKRLVETAMEHTGGDLPVVLPPDIDGDHERTYPWWELGNLAERLKQLTEVEGGPDIAFEPRLTTDKLRVEWVMRTGTPTNPLLQQAGADWQWDRGAARGSLRLLGVRRDPSQMAQRVLLAGDGMEDDMPLAIAEDLTATGQGWPLMERSESSNSTRQSELNAEARGYLSSSLRPWQTWTLATSQTQPEVGLYRPGDWATVHVPAGHIYLPAGEYRTRILEVSGGLDDKVNLKLAPTLEHR